MSIHKHWIAVRIGAAESALAPGYRKLYSLFVESDEFVLRIRLTRSVTDLFDQLEGRPSGDALELSLAGHLRRILGVDLTIIPGLNVLAVLSLISEIGTNMAKWRNEKAFVLDGIKPQQQGQWRAGVEFPDTQSQQSGGNDSKTGGNVVGQNRHPLGLVLPQETRRSRCPKGHHGNGTQTGLSDLSAHQRWPSLPRPDLHTYELKYKNQILSSLRRRANGFGFDLVELPKAA